MAAPKQTDPQFKLRMTPEIKEKIEAAAYRNSRSMNAEILARLSATFGPSADLVVHVLATIRDELTQETINIKIDKSTIEFLDETAEKLGLSRDRLVREIFDRAIEQVISQTESGKTIQNIMLGPMTLGKRS